jgi:hypothetical protein
MDFDRYDSPASQDLLVTAERRHSEARRTRRVLTVEGCGAGAFLAGAIAVALAGHSPRPLSIGPLALMVFAYVIAAQVKFPVGSAWTAPTQLVFVPMLFVLPTELVPLIVAACLLVDQVPSIVRGSGSPTRVLARIADSLYALGPTLVLVIGGGQVFSWHRWPLMLAAFGAQVAFDAGSGLARSWYAERISPRDQVVMLWLYACEACLSCIGVAIAAEAVRRPALVLLVLPLIALMWMFARERRERLDQVQMLSSAYRGTALLLGEVVEADDEYTGIHSRQVVDLSIALADAMRLNSTQRRNVEFTALLHDVGKIHVPKRVLNKPGQLDEAEWVIIRRHTIDGERMLRQVGGALASVGALVRGSHERFDGCGYPDGLAGDAIPIESRIVSICDAYNAMTTDRPYRTAISSADALAELRRVSGRQFDPEIVSVFVRLFDGTATPSSELAQGSANRPEPAPRQLGELIRKARADALRIVRHRRPLPS